MAIWKHCSGFRGIKIVKFILSHPHVWYTEKLQLYNQLETKQGSSPTPARILLAI